MLSVPSRTNTAFAGFDPCFLIVSFLVLKTATVKLEILSEWISTDA